LKREENGIIFTNLVNSSEKEESLKSTYSPNSGKPYNFGETLGGVSGFFSRNIGPICDALKLLQGR
jgi:hypothetical protein